MAMAGEDYRASAATTAQELHVLAVDDSYVDRMVIARLLKISSCKEQDKSSTIWDWIGEIARQSISMFEVNLIMTNCSMPGMTGCKLLKKIKNHKLSEKSQW